jgi:hypothetical protein
MMYVLSKNVFLLEPKQFLLTKTRCACFKKRLARIHNGQINGSRSTLTLVTMSEDMLTLLFGGRFAA